MKMCDQFIILHQGSIIKQGEKNQIPGLFEEINTIGTKLEGGNENVLNKVKNFPKNFKFSKNEKFILFKKIKHFYFFKKN